MPEFSLADITLYDVFVQSIGLIAMAVCVSRFLQDDFKYVFKVSMISNALYGIQLFLLLNPAGALVCAMGFTRSVIYSTSWGKSYKMYLIPPLIVMLLGSGVYVSGFSVKTLIVFIPLITYYAEYKGCTKLYRKSCAIAGLAWMVFALYAGSIGLFVSVGVSVAFCAGAMLRFDYPQMWAFIAPPQAKPIPVPVRSQSKK